MMTGRWQMGLGDWQVLMKQRFESRVRLHLVKHEIEMRT